MDRTAAGPGVLRWQVVVTGTVQGVGFRPHVHRLATGLGLAGHVGNDSGGVVIEVEGTPAALAAFRDGLVAEAPPLALIESVAVDEVAATGSLGFAIAESHASEGPVTTAPPDTAPCAACMREVSDPADRRHRYPFTTCTNCGPRFTIITALPYDRPATTMAAFPLCDPCAAEYHDPTDRRFHAQPLACPDCGPRVRLEIPTGVGEGAASTDTVLAAVQRLLADGAIVAVKGIGGFHLACRADDQSVVQRLRDRKHRPGKPFAVMVADLAGARQLGQVSVAEGDLLSSPAAPIVLLRRRHDAPLAAGIAPGNPLVGVMLPSSPLHYLLLAAVPDSDAPVPGPLVMTSGNLSEEPLCTADDEALDRLGDIADAWLLHDRPIAVPCDDSVVRLDGAALTMVRRSRGYVPTPMSLPFDGVPALAVGGQLKVTACLTDGRQAWLSQHVGDMGSMPTLRAFEQTVQRFTAMHRVDPQRLAADAHPEYTTRRWARAHADGRPVVEVQHHHAHIAAVMAEHRSDPGIPVIGVAFDGTGYGPDGTIWGGEVLLADYDGFRRLAHLSTTPLPGGDAAIRHPRRVALSHLCTAGITWDDDLAPVAATPRAERDLLATQLSRDLNCVPTSSAGRLFDAVASLLGVRHDITYEAQAAIELEILAESAGGAIDLVLPLTAAQDPWVLDAADLVRQVVAHLRAGAGAAALALGFHRALAAAVLATADRARTVHGSDVVALSGGVFANALLTRLTAAALDGHQFTVLCHRMVPPNDGGLALGQVAVAARRHAG
ncbi:carbamoyltransferase HypF [soil metagenome]